MTKKQIRMLLEKYRSGSISTDQVVEVLSQPMSLSLDHALVDLHRELRQGFPEVIFSEGKTPLQVGEIAESIVKHGSILLATRATREQFAEVSKRIPGARYNALARTITANEQLVEQRQAGTVLVVCAGTTDIPVAEEAVETARMMGNTVEHLYDVGVAGIHRILNENARLRRATAIIVVAGMEGALPSVVGGLVDIPVIAVPTSVGYGASFGGISALLGMLNSCAAGITVVNIDNGFGAGFAASRITSRSSKQSIEPASSRKQKKRKT
jgi:pyridinium-3,5-biscarboxylic acid mononucleotide synthase